jgi:hypothetical protein
MDVLWEQERDGLWEGLTANYVRVYTPACPDTGTGAAGTHLGNRLLPVRLAAFRGEDLLGEMDLHR